MQRNNPLFPLSVHLDLSSGFISTRYRVQDSDFSNDEWQLHCLSVSRRCNGVKRPTRHRALSPPHPLKSRQIGCNLVVPCNNNGIDFALGGQAMTSKPPSFVWSARLKITLQAHPFVCYWNWTDRLLEVRRRRGGYEFTENPWEVFSQH